VGALFSNYRDLLDANFVIIIIIMMMRREREREREERLKVHLVMYRMKTFSHILGVLIQASINE
jgi:hypothetical protein